jgi:hypothetical protein
LLQPPIGFAVQPLVSVIVFAEIGMVATGGFS